MKTVATTSWVILLMFLSFITNAITEKDPTTQYAITFIWIGFNWFYIRPRTIKKEQKKLREIIEGLENIDRQYNNL